MGGRVEGYSGTTKKDTSAKQRWRMEAREVWMGWGGVGRKCRKL